MDSDLAFIILIIPRANLIPIKMNPKEILLKEISDRVGDKISEQTISEKVNHFVRYGNVFLFFEVMSLRKEIERIKDEVRSIRDIIEVEKLKVHL